MVGSQRRSKLGGGEVKMVPRAVRPRETLGCFGDAVGKSTALIPAEVDRAYAERRMWAVGKRRRNMRYRKE